MKRTSAGMILPAARAQASAALLVALVLTSVTGCGNKNDPATPQATQAPTRVGQESSGAVQPALVSWQQGDKATAVNQFLATDWSARPLFAPGSTLNMSEKEFVALPAADRNARAAELSGQADVLKKLAAAVADAGRDAAAKDPALARKHFTALQQFGEALDSPDSLALLKLVGRAVKRMAETEMSKLPK
jgi:predicted small lipoprotein YifL